MLQLVTREVPYTMQLMHFHPNSLAASAAMAWRIVGPLAPIALASTVFLISRFGLERRTILAASWLLFGFALPVSMPFIFPRFFSGMIVPSVLLSGASLRAASLAP